MQTNKFFSFQLSLDWGHPADENHSCRWVMMVLDKRKLLQPHYSSGMQLKHVRPTAYRLDSDTLAQKYSSNFALALLQYLPG